MAVENKDVLKRFGKIKKNIEESYSTFEGNRKRFNKFMKFIFETSLTDEDIQVLEATGKPVIEFNSLEPYVSRLLGEFAKQEPNIEIQKKANDVDPAIIDVVGGILRAILADANNDSFEYNIYNDQLGGGYSVMKIWTEYEHENSFDQVIKIGKVYDSTLTGFDPLARQSHKQDGQYCFELYPKTKEDFKESYPNEDITNLSFVKNIGGFQWQYQNSKTEIVLMADYYQKKKKRVRIYKLSDGQTGTEAQYKEMLENWTSIEQPPEIVQSRWTTKTIICRYVVIEDRVLEYEETQLPNLPLIFVDGHSVLVKTENDTGSAQQITRPYVYQALGAQKLKNFAGQSLGNELENLMQSKYIVDKDAIPEDAVQDWLEPQKVSTLVWQSKDKNEQPLPAPMPVQRSDIPGIIAQTFSGADQAIQNILGSFDAQLGINEKDLSGIAIQEGATQNNAVAMPYVTGFMMALNAAAQMMLEMIPLYYATPRTLPSIDQKGQRTYAEVNQQGPGGVPMPGSPQLSYDPNALDVRVEAGYNFEVQKSKAMSTITSLMQVSEGFRAMMEQQGLPILVDNIDIKGADQLKQMAEQFMQKQQQQQAQAAQAAAQGQQNNPQMMAAQAKMQELQLQQQKMQADIQLDQAKLQLEQQKIDNQHTESLMRIQTQQEHDEVQAQKAQAENIKSMAQIHLQSHDQAHQHTQDYIKHYKDSQE